MEDPSMSSAFAVLVTAGSQLPDLRHGSEKIATAESEKIDTPSHTKICEHRPFQSL